MRQSPWLLVARGDDGISPCPGMLPEWMVHPGQQSYSQRLLERLSGRALLVTLEKDWGLATLWGQGRSDGHPLPSHQLSSSWPSRVVFSPSRLACPSPPGPSLRVRCLFHSQPTVSFSHTIERLTKITCPRGL